MLTVIILIVVSLGGLLVAATLKYADAILKCFATAFSIILTTVVGYYWLEAEVDLFVLLGVILTVTAILNYTLDDIENPKATLIVNKD